MMPDGAAPARASVLAEMSVMMHELETGDELADLLAAARLSPRPIATVRISCRASAEAM